MYFWSSWTRSYSSFNKRPFDDILGAEIKRKNRFVNEIEDTDFSHKVPSNNLLKEQANSKEENDSDDDE